MKIKQRITWLILALMLSAMPGCLHDCGDEESPYSPPTEETDGDN